MRFDLRHVRSFITLAEVLHFSRAADRLNMTQPGMSRLIGELEREVGVPLFRRTTRSVELTEAGKAFLAEARLALERLERAVSLARRTASGETGVLRIGYMDFAINGRLPEFLRSFSRLRPDIRLELSFIATLKQHEALLADRIDIGFMIGPVDQPGMASYTFDSDRYVALLPITHPLSNVRSLKLADLAGEPFVLGSGENWGAFRNQFFSLCHRAGFTPDIVQEASSSEGIFGLVAAGAGVSVYASCVRNVQRRGIVIRELEDVSGKLLTCAAWVTPVQSPSVEVFTSYLSQIWGGQPAVG
ncbi:LysR family transcriptional regulator [Azorhizobium doebereinerae]|uniref:LysR family transcriptional regulator n=1 Tax=Azorhizobium doebereinerae TaxID=281091 RepID=UPI0004193FD1|nr:LysR family transcriptional regulator [Azorhizobium doebereinerae]